MARGANSSSGGFAPSGGGLLLAGTDVNALAPAYAHFLIACHQRFVTLAPLLPESLRDGHRRASDTVLAALATDRRGTLRCYASPTIGCALQAAVHRDDLTAFRDRIDASLASVVPHLLLELAIRGLIAPGSRVDWPHPTAQLASLSLGVQITPPPGTESLRFAANELTALRAGAVLETLRLDAPTTSDDARGFRIETKYLRVGGITRFALIDHNPLAAFEAHPEKHGNHVDLGNHTADAWVAMLDQAFALIAGHCAEVFGEMRMLLHEVIPVGFDRERHLSASYREAIGTVYVTLHPNVMTMAEALIHEFQHNKLNLASYGDDFLENAFEPRFHSPVRPDPRPLWGILLAVHAFIPVAVLYRRMRAAAHPLAAAPEFAHRLAEIDLKNHEGIQMLRAHAVWTAAGRALLADLDALDRAHMTERSVQGLSTSPTDTHIG